MKFGFKFFEIKSNYMVYFRKCYDHFIAVFFVRSKITSPQ